MFKLHYHCSNGGDGSVSVHFHQSAEEAEKADEAMDEGWGESSASYITLKVYRGLLYYRDHEYVDGKQKEVWKPVEKAK